MLDNVELFNGLAPSERETIASHAISRTYPKDTLIMERGSPGDLLFLLIEGRVKIFIDDDNGKEIQLNEEGPGAYLGDLALLSGATRTASVTTLEECRFLVLTKEAFVDCLSAHPELAFNLIRGLVERIYRLTEDVSDLALLDVYGRVTKTLMECSSEMEGRRVTEPFTHKELASRVGASREMVSKILKDLRFGGYIGVEGRQFVINRKFPAKW